MSLREKVDMISAPILVLGYNRPDYLKSLLEFLKSQKNFRLYVSIDGPALNNSFDEYLVKECRRLAIETQEWSDTRLLFSDSNNGCYLGVTKAIDWFFENEEFGIILEDDLVFDSTAITFLTHGLLEFSENTEVGAICAFNLLRPYSISDAPITSQMVSFPSSWGWATWRDRWVKIERDFSSYSYPLFLYRSIKYGGLSGVRTWLHVRKRLENKTLDSWGYRWLLTHCRYGWKAVVPSRSLVTNIGFREDATHTKGRKTILGVQKFGSKKSNPNLIFNKNLNQDYDAFLLRNVYGVIPIGEKIMSKIRSALQ
jgi:hypothetical protein